MTDGRAKATATLVIRGLRQCLTMDGAGDGPYAGASQEAVGLIEEAAIAAAGERLLYVGPASRMLEHVRVAPEATRVDAGGGVALPGFIDPHTHLLFGGWRAREFELRLRGASYQQILEAGGGILNTVERTRAATEEELVELGSARLRRMLETGTTTVEAKSGYGLSMAAEARLVRAARRLDATEPADVAVTLLGAHAVPREYRDDRGGYLRLVREMIEALADRVEFVDAFCEQGAFTVPECREVFAAARRHGLRPKLHADQLHDTGGAELAAEVEAISADHLDYISTRGIEAMAGAGVIGVLLPSVPLYVMSRRQAPAERMIEAGVPLALATDFNPGTSPVQSMGLIVALACMLLRMSPAAALVAATRNGAFALDRADTVGSLREGMLADLQIYVVRDYRMLPYRFGELRPAHVFKRGVRVAGAAASAT
jgi:imidazolonepropionase